MRWHKSQMLRFLLRSTTIYLYSEVLFLTTLINMDLHWEDSRNYLFTNQKLHRIYNNYHSLFFSVLFLFPKREIWAGLVMLCKHCPCSCLLDWVAMRDRGGQHSIIAHDLLRQTNHVNVNGWTCTKLICCMSRRICIDDDTRRNISTTNSYLSFMRFFYG